MSTQQERMDKIGLYTYRAMKHMIPTNLDEDVLDIGNHFSFFHFLALVRVCLDYGTDYEKQYVQYKLYKFLTEESPYGKVAPDFTGGFCYRFVYHYKDKCDKKIIDEMTRQLIDMMKAGYVYERKHDFYGVNDNFPSLDSMCSYYHYLLTGDKDVYNIVLRRLREFKERLTRVTDSSEFNSLTYLQTTVQSMAEIVNISPVDDPIHGYADYCLQELILMLFRRYHKTVKLVGGPHGRSYSVDSVGHYHHMDFILYQLLGEDEFVDLPEILFSKEYYEDGHLIHGDATYYYGNFYNGTRSYYHISDRVWNEYKSLTNYPYEVIGRAELSSSFDRHTTPLHEGIDLPREAVLTDEVFEYPAGVSNLYTYMGKEFSMGSCDKEFHMGWQCESFSLKMRSDNGNPVSFYSRMLVNESAPHARVFMTDDMGRKSTMQSRDSLVCTYHLKNIQDKIQSAKLSIIAYNHFNVIDEIVKKDNEVFVRVGKEYIMFAPISDKYVEKLEINTRNDFLMIDMYMPLDDIANEYKRGRMLNLAGFICEVRDVENYKNMDEFAKDVSGFTINEKLYACELSRMTAMRRTTYENKHVKFEMLQDIVGEGIMYRTIERKTNDKILSIRGSL